MSERPSFTVEYLEPVALEAEPLPDEFSPSRLRRSLAVLAVLVPRPLPQLKLWLPLVPQPYVYAPLLATLVLWSMLTTGARAERASDQPLADDPLSRLPDAAAISAA
jgi:hypothetical protein